MLPASPIFHTEELVKLPFNKKALKAPSPNIKMSMLECRAPILISFWSSVTNAHHFAKTLKKIPKSSTTPFITLHNKYGPNEYLELFTLTLSTS